MTGTQHTEQLDTVRSHFDEIGSVWASRYTSRPRRMSDLDLQLRRRHALKLLQHVADNQDSAHKVLDVGCGPGDLFDSIPTGRLDITGVDLSSEMIEQARQHYPGNRYEVADIHSLPFPDDDMDIVTSLGVLEYLPDPSAALNEIRRVIRPQGWFIISFPNRLSAMRTFHKVERAVEYRLIRVVHSLRGKKQQDDVPRYNHNQWSPAEALELLENNGFMPHTILFNTFGPYGRLGRLSPVISISSWLTGRFAEQRAIAQRLAMTMVILAQSR